MTKRCGHQASAPLLPLPEPDPERWVDSELALRRWKGQFRTAARADSCRLLRDQLRRLGVAARPETVVRGTIDLMEACLVYSYLDGQALESFVASQTYDPADSPAARYALFFDLCGHAYGRVLVDRDLRGLDLADLYGHPWERYRVCGFHELWITRIDGAPVRGREAARLEKAVADDLLFDYGEDEVRFWFDGSPPGALLVHVQDSSE